MNACGNIRIATLFARPLALATSNSEIHGNDRTSSTRPFARMSSTAVIDHSVGTSRRRSFVPSRPTEKTRGIWLWEIPWSYRSVTAAPAPDGRDEGADQAFGVPPRADDRTRRGRPEQIRRLQIPPFFEPRADPSEVWTDGEPTPFDVATADATVDLATDLRKARPDPILRPRRSGGRGNGHGQAAGVAATGFGGAGAGDGFSSTMTSSQRV